MARGTDASYLWGMVGRLIMQIKRQFQGLINIYHWLVGAGYVVANGRPAKRLKVIGVTGTDGKTTTCHLIYEILLAAGKKVALVSTVAAYIGNEELDTGFHVTNLDPKVLQELLRKIADKGFEYLVLEVTSHGLDQNRLVGINFKVGVITNITHEHLDYHKSFERYRETKAKLVLRAQYSVLNKNDPSTEWIKARCDGKVIEFGKYDGEVGNVLDSGYNRQNLAAAAAVAKILGVEEMVPLVAQSFSGVPGRMEEIKLGQKFRAIVDFAHTPNALENVLRELRTQLDKRPSSAKASAGKQKLIVVFGCASQRDVTKRPIMGEIATRLADKVIITAEDPRTESLDEIYNQITSPLTPLLTSGEGKRRGEVFREDDRQKAITMAVKMARPGDIVVATGKGHEKSMCFGTIEYPWSDREAMEKAIGG